MLLENCLCSKANNMSNKRRSEERETAATQAASLPAAATETGDISLIKPDDEMRENQSSAANAAEARARLISVDPEDDHPNHMHYKSHQQTRDYQHPHRCHCGLSLLTPLLIVAFLAQQQQQQLVADGAELRHRSSAFQKRYLTVMEPPVLDNSEQHARPMQPMQQQPHHHQQQQQQQQQQLSEQRRNLVSALTMADLLQKNHQHQQRSLWSQDASPALHQQAHEQQPTGSQQFVSYRPLAGGASASTMPTINRQIQPPNPFYELSFAPTNTLQIEHHHDSSNQHHENGMQHSSAGDELEPHFAAAMSQPSPVRLEPPQQQHSPPASSGGATTVRSVELPQRFESQQQQHQHQSEASIQVSAESNSQNSKATTGGVESARNSQQQDQQAAAAPVDKIEPRQRRRLFNRILKKAEWNHLFVELSKVFLRYFLDLALKDIIGKQSGSTTAGGGGSETTSRKKLDAQSELADLLKEFVKNAISNI